MGDDGAPSLPDDGVKLHKFDANLLKAVEEGADIPEIEQLLKGCAKGQDEQAYRKANPLQFIRMLQYANEIEIKGLGCEDMSGESVLTLASAAGRTNVVRFFLERGVHPDVADKTGITALMRAAGEGHFGAVEALLEGGAQVDAIDKFGNTALHRAAQYGKMNVAKRLLLAGASVSVKERRLGETPISLARFYNQRELATALELSQTSEGMRRLRVEVEALSQQHAEWEASAVIRVEAEVEAKTKAKAETLAAEDAKAKAALLARKEARAVREAAEASAKAKAADDAAAGAEAVATAEADRLGVLELLRFAGCADSATVSRAVEFCTREGIESDDDLEIMKRVFVDALDLPERPKARLSAALEPSTATSCWMSMELCLFHQRRQGNRNSVS